MPPHIPPITIFHPTTPIVLGLFSRGRSEYYGTVVRTGTPYLRKHSAGFNMVTGVLLSARPSQIKWDTCVLHCSQPLMLPRGLTASQVIQWHESQPPPCSQSPGNLRYYYVATEIPQFYEIDLGQVKDCFVHGPESGPSVPQTPSLEPALHFEIQFHMRRYCGDRSESLF
jgi:hypothetical protein